MLENSLQNLIGSVFFLSNKHIAILNTGGKWLQMLGNKLDKELHLLIIICK